MSFTIYNTLAEDTINDAITSTTFGSITVNSMSGTILPDPNTNLGSPTQSFANIYADHIYAGSNSITIGNDVTLSNLNGSLLVPSITTGALANNYSISIGQGAGTDGLDTISLGNGAGSHQQGNFGIAVGFASGFSNQGNTAIAIGEVAGQYAQGAGSVSIGSYAGNDSQGVNSVAIGKNAGKKNQGPQAVSIGVNSANTNQSQNAIAIGNRSGSFNQGINSVAIGFNSGYGNQANYSVAIGENSGYNLQGLGAVAIGSNSGSNNQGTHSIAIGINSGLNTQGQNGIAIGNQSGSNNQGAYSIALGAFSGISGQASNSIIINSSGNPVDASFPGLFIAPVRSVNTGSASPCLTYDTSSKEIKYNPTKTFIVDHPLDKNKYLIHACLEGPEAGVYYRGKGEIKNNEYVVINLPKYVNSLATEFTVQLTRIFDSLENKDICYQTSKIVDNKFTVYGKNGEFFWTVYGKRKEIIVEIPKNDVSLKGEGPYKWI